jgi:hypothetical protein
MVAKSETLGARAHFLTGKEFRSYSEPIFIEAGSISLEELLDRVSVRSGVNYWVVLQSNRGNECQVSVILW